MSATPNIPGFEFAALLGRGGMGEVWKARQQGIGRWVAVKVLHPQFSEDEDYVDRFLREARIVGKLAHPNIVRAFDCGQSDGRSFLVMEYVEGQTLEALLRARGVFPEREALLLVRPIADALQHAWNHRIIHRDVKPQNVLVTPDGTPKLCDLGLSRDISTASRLTLTGYIACTPAYASPEQANGEPDIDTRSDVYSLGVVLYELVTGQLPFQSPSPAALLVKHVSENPKPPMSRNARISPGLNQLILDMLEKPPARRPRNPGEVVSRIDGILLGKESPAPTPKTTRIASSRRRRMPGQNSPAASAAVIGGGIAAVVLVAVIAASSGGGGPAPVAARPRPSEPAVRASESVPPPPPMPRANPQPAPPSPVGPSRAEAAVRALREFRASHPDDLPALIRETEKTLLDLTGTPFLEETRRDLESLKLRRKEELAAAKAGLDVRVAEAVAKEKFGAAIGAWSESSRRYPDAPWAAESSGRIEEVRKTAEATYATLATQGAEAARKGDGAAVDSIRKRIAAWEMPVLAGRFEEVVTAGAPAAKPTPAPAPAPIPASPAPVSPAPAARPKPPASGERTKIRSDLRALYKEGYAKSMSDDVRAFAAKLLEDARRPENDAARRFVFLEDARDQAVRCGNAAIAFSAVEGIVAEYEVDARREWSDVLGKLKVTARDAFTARAFVTACVDRARLAIRADEYDLAADFLEAGRASAGAAGAGPALLKAQGDLQRARAGYRAAQKDLEKLKANPDDPDANLSVGRFLCSKGDWPRGLEHLSKGSDKALREAAGRERAAGTDPAKLAEAADAWVGTPELFREHGLELYEFGWATLAGERRDRARDVLLKARAHEGSVKDAAPTVWFIGIGTRRELFRLDATRSRTGRSCLRIDAGEPTGWMSQGHFPTLEGKEYEFSAWVLTDRTEAWDVCHVYFYTDQAKPPFAGTPLRAPADQPWWTPLRVRLKTPPGAKSFQVMVAHGFAKGTIWVDDFSLRALDTGEEIVANGGFEK